MKIYKLIISLIIIATLAISCDSTFLDVNENPNSTTKVSPELVLPVAQAYSAQSISNHRNRGANTIGNFMVNNWSQSSGYSWYDEEYTYKVTSTFYNVIWEETYRNTLSQYDDLLTKSYGNIKNYKAIALIMKSMHFQTLVDFYGNIPYSEALLRGDNPTPKYDDAQTIYEDLIVKLNEAFVLIDEAAEDTLTELVPGDDDVMFHGDMDKWKQLANTIKLRILVRQSDIAGRGGYITDEFNKIVAEGSGFITADVSVNPGYLNEENKQNPFWDFYGMTTAGTAEFVNNHKATCATQYVIDKLESYSDDRIDFIYLPPALGPHKGVRQGTVNYPDLYTEDYVSRIGSGLLKSFDQNAVVFALADSYFLQAEAQLKGLLTGDAEASFDMGVTASFDYLGATGAVAYLSSGNEFTDYSASTNKLETIMIQKWIGLNGIDASQNWFDWSRTGYPNDLPVSLLSPKPQRPVRLHYPASEFSSNASNVPAQPDVFTEKIFWAN